VAYHIGERFGGDPVGRHFYGCRQRRHLTRNVEPDLHRRAISPPDELISSLSQSSNQPELIQRGRPQIVNQPAYVAQCSARIAAQGRQQAL
jgi:hypothetical protein